MALTKVTGSVIKDSVSLSGNVSIGGTLTYQDVTNVDAVGIITARSDISIADKIIHTGDTNTAIRFPSDDTFTIETAGSERLRVASSGNLIISGITTSNSGFMFGTDGEMYLYKSAANTATLRITSDGPYAEFKDVSGDVQMGSASGTLRISSGGTERLRIDTNGKLLVGHTADIGNIRTQFNQNNQFVGATSAGIKIGTYANNPYASSLEFIKSRSATLGTNTLIQNGDTLGTIMWGAADGANYQPAAYVSAVIDGAPNTNDVPTRLSFGTAKDGAAGAGEKMRINPAGQIMIGDNTVGNSTTEKLILQGQIGNDNFESSVALRRGSTIGTNDAGLGYIKFQDSAGSTGAQIGGRADNAWSGSSRATHLLFQTVKNGSTSLEEACRITSAGYLQQHKLIAVSYSDSRGISLTNVDLTPSNFYNATFFASDSTILDSNGHFVAPIHGIYRLYFRCTTDSNSGNRANVRLRKNGNTINEAYDSTNASGHYNSVSSEIILPLNAGEYMDIQVSQLHTQAGTQHKIVNFHMLG